MADIDANIPIIVAGSEDVVYDKVYIQNLQITAKLGEGVAATAVFRRYRVREDGSHEEAPLWLDSSTLNIPNLNEVLGAVEGGTYLKDAVEAAFISLGKAYGII